MKTNGIRMLAAGLVFFLGAPALRGQPALMESLGRGVVAIRSGATDVFVSWRVLGTDDDDVAFNLYRSTDGAAPVRLNAAPIVSPTHYQDATADLARTNAYSVRPIVFGVEQAASTAFALPANAPVQPYLRVPLQVPPAGTTPAGEAYTYAPNDTSVGDLDGDGEYELVVKWDPSNAHDNSQSGYTGNVYLDGYDLDGTRLWRIDLGRNIRAGAHYTQFMVFDLDGDGRAELACKTADGTVDGAGTVIGNAAADWRNASGYVLDGPEFLTVFDGRTGAALATTQYVVPRGTVSDWGDGYGNRVDRFLAAVAYLDGRRPSLVMARGYYTRAVLAAWNWRDGQLTNVWTFDTGHAGTASPYAAWRGQGNHNLSVADVDGDGRDEIVYGAAAIDHDGTGLYSTGLGHGDALHVSDMAPDRPGLEVFQPHESPSAYGPNALELRDARTGALVLGVQATGDIGRGLALDVDPRYRGYEMWGAGDTGGMYTAQLAAPNALLGPRGTPISANRPSINFGVWWDGDLLRELLDGTTISKWNWLTGSASPVLAPAGVSSNNGTKATPALSADILGDWREEVIWRESTNDALRIYTTTIPTTHRLYTLMHDRQYRLAIAWQNVAYNQPPHPGFFLGDGMAPPPRPDIVTSLATLLGPAAPVITGVSEDTGSSASDFVTRDTTLVISGTAQPLAAVTLTRFGIGVVGTTPADSAGAWSVDYGGSPLGEGVTRFAASATDQDARTGPSSAPLAVTVDLTAPPPPVIESVASESTLVLEGTAEPGSTVEATLSGSGPVATGVAGAGGRWTAAYAGPPLAPAPHTFTATTTDQAGNTSATSGPVMVNTAVLTPAIVGISDDTGPSAADGVTADNTLVLRGTAAAGDVVSIRLSAATVGSATPDASGGWSFDYSGTVLPEGLHLFRAAAASADGTSPSSAAFAVTVDTVAPLAVSSSRVNPAAATSTADTVTFRVAFSEPVVGVDGSDFTPVFTGGLAGAVTQLSAAGGASVDVTVGPMTGEGTVRLDVAAGGVTDLAGHPLAAGFSAGQTYSRLLAGDGTWIRSTSGGLWGDNANWQEGIVGSGVGTTASFAAIEVEGDTLVQLDSPRTVGALVFGDTDTASAASWIVDDGGLASNALTFATGSGSPAVTVNPLGSGAAAVLAARLAGNAGLAKQGAGTLVLTRENALAGTLNVNAGTLRLDAGATLDTGSGTVNVTVTPGALLHVAGGTLTAGGLATIGSGRSTPGLFTIDSGTATFEAGARTNSEGGSTFRVNGGIFNATDVNIRRNSAGSVDFNSGFIVAGGVANVGTIGIGTNNSNGALTVSGGALTATGAVTIGNQTSAGRGGAMRVLGGSFTSTDVVNGLVLARNAGTNVNNVATASFNGGVSTVEKLTLGFNSAVTAGSATVNLDGGTLYVGSGGIVKNGTSAFAANLNFRAGILGARASWSTDVPINLPAPGSVIVKTADATEVGFDVTFGGAMSGAGGLRKTGSGTLALTGASTFSGALELHSGFLRLDGSLAAGEPLAVAGGVLGGVGVAGRQVVLGAEGTIQPGGAAPGSVLTVGSLAWSPGGTLAVDLTHGNRLAVTGALHKSAPGLLQVALSASAPLAVGTASTLATFAATDAVPADFAGSAPPGHLGVFLVGPDSLQYLVTGAGATAAYTHWAYLSGLPAGQDGPADDPDDDALSNLVEFVLARDPMQPGVQPVVATVVEAQGLRYPAISFVRRRDTGGVDAGVAVSRDLEFASLLGAEEIEASPRGDGSEDVLVRSTVPLSVEPRQFFRVTARFPEPEQTLWSLPVGALTGVLRRGQAGLALPLVERDLFVGIVAASSASSLAFPDAAGELADLLQPEGRYYVEVVTGALQGERFDVDVDATIAAGGPRLALALGAGSHSTLAALPAEGLLGARCVLRPHLTLARLQALLAPGLAGSDRFAQADGVLVYQSGELQRYSLRADGETWSRPGSDDDFRHLVLPPDAGFLLSARSAAQAFTLTGNVRTNDFRKNLIRGLQPFASGFPVDLSPARIGGFVDPGAPEGTRWTGHNSLLLADQIQLLLAEELLELYYLRADGATWRSLHDPADVRDEPIVGATGAVLVRRVRPDGGYRVPLPFTP